MKSRVRRRALLVGDGVLGEFVRHARACLPEEACGFLAGHGDHAERFVPAANALHSPTAFEVDPGFLFGFYRSLRSTGEKMVAVCHSHPGSLAEPSKRDIDAARYTGAAHVIVSFAGPRPAVRAWRVFEDEAVEIELHAIV